MHRWNGLLQNTESLKITENLSKKNIDDLEAGHRDIKVDRRDSKGRSIRLCIVEAEKRRRALLEITME